MYQTGGTIKETLEKIAKDNYVLPAIQREFVWKPEQISKLFDSLMQEYPFGTFLLWSVDSENTDKYKFYKFMRHYHQRDNPHCEVLEDIPSGSLTAVLDGQQRLTALNIGLRGSMTLKLANKWWNNPTAFPQKRLYLNLLHRSDADEEGIRYQFDFLTPESAKQDADSACWYPVSDIMEIDGAPSMLTWVNSRLPQEQVNDAFRVLDRLYQVIHNKVLVAYYEEKSQNLEKVLNIFIRTNSGGTVLSYSDLLLSIAVAQWKNHDARDEIHTAVDQLNDIGNRFSFSKDLVLKAGLMLSDIGNVGFKVENFNKINMEKLETNWSDVKDALLLTVQLISSFGYDAQTLRADSAILPIAYYLFRLQPGDQFINHTKYDDDRKKIKTWFVRSMLKASGIWGSGLDTLLTSLREVIKTHGAQSFPYIEIKQEMAKRGKSLNFDIEEIEELVDMSYGDKRLFSLLSSIFPFLNTGVKFHIDHIYPKSKFTRKNLGADSISEEKYLDLKNKSNRLSNLQLLLDVVNNEKRKALPHDWLITKFKDEKERDIYISQHILFDLEKDIAQFENFYQRRRERLKEKIQKLLTE